MAEVEKKEKSRGDSDITKHAPRRTPSNKVKLHRYYKGIIAMQKTPEQRAISKRMWVGLLKEVGQYKVA